MGNCCTAESQKEIVLTNMTAKKPKAFTSFAAGDDELLKQILDEREVAGYSGINKIILIERIQSVFRRKLAARRVSVIRNTKQLQNFSSNVNSHVAEYSNQEVNAILKNLGPFDYGTPEGDGVRREKRPITLIDNKTKYEGEWNLLTNERDGMGVLVWPDGSIYEGFWRRNKANGKGRLIHADKDVYLGDWLDDKAHGNGSYIHADGAKYVGEWYMDKQQGKGFETWPDSAQY